MQRYFGSTAIDGTMNASQVALAAIRKHFVAMLDNETGTLEGSDPERLHDMRVATRRMRAAFGVFRPWLSPNVAAFASDLKQVGGALGLVRDFDVQLEHQREWARRLENEQALEPWFALLEASRLENRQRLVAELQSEGYARFVKEFGEALLHAEPVDQAPNILEAAPIFVKKRWKKLKSALASFDSLTTDAEMHEARILAKRLRYSIEFVAPVYGPAAKETSATLAKLQDVLGLHQDCVVAIQTIRESLDKTGGSLPGSTSFELGRLACLADQIRQGQRALVRPTYEAVRRGPWRELKPRLVAPSADAATPASIDPSPHGPQT